MPNEIKLDQANNVYKEKQLWRPFRGLTIDCESSKEDFFRVRYLDYYLEELYGL